MTYFVEFETKPDQWHTFHGFYDSLDGALAAAQSTLIPEAHFRIIGFEPSVEVEGYIGGMTRTKIKGYWQYGQYNARQEK